MEPTNTTGTTGKQQATTGQSIGQQSKTNPANTEGSLIHTDQDQASFSGPANPNQQQSGYGKNTNR